MDKISKWGWIGDRGERVLTITGYEQLTANELRCSQLAVCSAITRLQSLGGRDGFFQRCERREDSGFGDFECFSHSLVTVWQKVQKCSSEKQVIGEDENEGRHPNKTTTEK